MNSLGIYFGPQLISIVEVKGRKIINKAQVSQAAISTGDLEEKLPVEVKSVAVLKDALRRNKIEAQQAELSLSGRDLIVRTFELPGLPKEEVLSAVNFEAKKYLPFKLEELISDFAVSYNAKDRSNAIAFAGIKKETLEKHVSVLKQLNIKVSGIEYTGFSALKALKLAAVQEKGVFALLCFDLQESDEVSFMVIENGFPLFVRDITLGEAGEGIEKTAGQPEKAQGCLEKLRSEIRVSLDYYRRKQQSKSIKELLILGNDEWRSSLEAFCTEVSLAPKFVDYSRILGKQMPYSLGFIKAYSAALGKAIRLSFNIDLVASQGKQAKPHMPGKDLSGLFKGVKFNPKVLILGAFVCLGVVIYRYFALEPLRKELKQTIEVQKKTALASPEATLDELEEIFKKTNDKLNNLKLIVDGQLYATIPMNVIPAALPEGVWLVDFSLSNSKGDSKIILKGIAYLDDSDKEFAAVNKFVYNLRAKEEFTKFFGEISLGSVSRATVIGLQATSFEVNCISKAAKAEGITYE